VAGDPLLNPSQFIAQIPSARLLLSPPRWWSRGTFLYQRLLRIAFASSTNATLRNHETYDAHHSFSDALPSAAVADGSAKTNLRQRDRPNPSHISDLSEETLHCDWAGIMIYTLALQSVSMPVCTIARLFRWRRIPNPPRYRTLDDALICRLVDQTMRRCKHSVVVPFRTSLRPLSHPGISPLFCNLCAIETSQPYTFITFPFIHHANHNNHLCEQFPTRIIGFGPEEWQQRC
jgi:hypothetical protein